MMIAAYVIILSVVLTLAVGVCFDVHQAGNKIMLF